MYIKNISLEGFKSYGQKVVVPDFDPGFNAITGLNGSGKSNILDSICFVLGISNLQTVRATTLNELVYKNGQAGINKAVVTITFDNSERDKSPTGYENVKEIVVTRTLIAGGGKSKYFINNSVANNTRVQDLFQSVQLNVNNPHFLIMQGRITKVLNMKPLEILSMVEEAAGTRMYEEKKAHSIRSLEKKESRLREINNLLTENISPQLEKLKAEKADFANYTKMQRELEQLEKLYTAWDYTNTEALVKESGSKKEALIKKYEEHKELIKDLKQKIQEADAHISKIEKQMDKECGSQLKEAEELLKKKQVEEAKSDTQVKNLKDALNTEKKKHAENVKNFKEEKIALAQKEKEMKNSATKLGALKSVSDKDSEAITKAENHFHAVNAGLADAEGDEASLSSQLIVAEKDKKDAETEAKSLEMSMKHIKAELVKKEAENKKVDKSYTQDQALYQKLFNEAQKIKNEIAKLNYKEGTFENLSTQERSLTMETNALQKELDSTFDRYPRLSFEYSNPVHNFDRSRVLGPLALHMEIKDPKEATALELIAGAKLYDVIVEDHETAKLVLDKGKLRQRRTLLPLNKMQSNVINNKVIQDAEQLVGRNNMALALNRIVFDKHVAPAMEFAFGGTLICPDMEKARTVAFANHIKKRTVTWEGEVFDPQGTLSGGSLNNRSKLLSDLLPLPKLKKAIQDKQNQLTRVQKEIQNIIKVKDRYNLLCEQYELKENEAELLKAKIQNSSHHKQVEELKKMQEDLEEQQTRLISCKEKQKNAEKKIKELEAKSSKNTRESKVKAAEKAVADAKKKAAVSLEKYNTYQAEVDGLRLEIETIVDGLPTYEKHMQANFIAIEDCETNVKAAVEGQKTIKDEIAKLSNEVKKQKATLKSHSSEMNKTAKDKEAMNKQIADTELQMQQLEHDIKDCGGHTSDASKKLKHLAEKNKWIEGQKKYFGVKNSEFDFNKFNPRETSTKLRQLQDNIQKLQKTVNTKAQNMLVTTEKQYDSLMAKRKSVLEDKAIIEDSITKLDYQKNCSLKTACEQVNQDFGSIFESLLPGTQAKLLPPPGKTFTDGLEFKIAFGSVWKESLAELSGGQRSLVALSLVLALLRFHPAPIYILDEVDAALDLSHTQNIGSMLKKHFQKSQFIIVSLKDGMFNNANVLFRTKFSDGMSSVSRTTQK